MKTAALIMALATVSCSGSVLSATTTPAEQLQGEWEGTDLPDGIEAYVTISEDRFTLRLSVVPDEGEGEQPGLIETIIRGVFSATEDSLTLLPDAPTEILIDGLDVDIYLRKQFEDAGLEAPPDSVIAELMAEFLGDVEDYESLTTAYDLQGDRLTLSIDGTPITLIRREEMPTSAKTTTWGSFKSRR